MSMHPYDDNRRLNDLSNYRSYSRALHSEHGHTELAEDENVVEDEIDSDRSH